MLNTFITSLFAPTIDTNAYASGDVLFVTTSFSALRANNDRSVINSVVAIDEDDQGQGVTLLFFDTNVTFGTINNAPSISDADARSFLGSIVIAAADWVDLGGVRVAHLRNLNLPIKGSTDSQNVFVAALCTSGTPTYTASGLKFRFGITDGP